MWKVIIADVEDIPWRSAQNKLNKNDVSFYIEHYEL